MQKLLNPEEVADMLGVKKSTVYQWTHQGYIPHIKLGNTVRFKINDIERWLDKKTIAGRTRRVTSIDL